MSTRMRRVLLFVVIVAASLSFGYVILGNGFLLAGGIRWMCRGTNTVRVEYTSAWTVWPGVVHARDLVVTIQDPNIQSSMRFDTAEVSIRLSELFRRVFHARRVRGSGFEFRFRHRVMPESAKLPAVLAKAPIAGFEDPPIFDAGPPEPPIPDDRYRLWTIELDDVDVGARDIWVEQFRYLGRARARGAFRLRPARQLWVGPAALDLEPGRLVARGRDASANFSGRIECEVRPFDVRIPKGLAVMRFVSAKTNLHGDVPSGIGAELFMDEKTRVEPRNAHFDAEVAMHEGILAPSGRIRLGGSRLSIQSDDVWTELGDPWELIATGDDSGPGGRVALRVSTASLHESACGSMSLGVSGLSLDLASSTRDAAVPWELERAHVGVGGLSMEGRWGSITVSGHAAGELTAAPGTHEGTPSEMTLTASAGSVRVRSDAGPDDRWSVKVPTLRASARLGEGLRGPVSLVAERVAASVGHTRTTFDVGAELRVLATDPETRRTSLGGYVDVRNASISTGDRRIENWWANIRFDRMHLLLERGLEFAGRVSARLRDGVPGLLVLAERDEVPDWLPSFLPLHDLSGSMDVQRRCRTIDVAFQRLEGGPLSGSGRIISAPGGTKGAFLVRWNASKVLTAGIELDGGSGKVAPFAGDGWIDDKRAEMEADSARERAAPCPSTPRCGG